MFLVGQNDQRQTPGETKAELAGSLRRLLELCGRHKEALRAAAAKRPEPAAAAGGKKRRGADDGAAALLSLVGGGLGAVVGGVSGGLWGLLGAAGAAAYTGFSGDVSAVGASVGFMGGALGGLVGGAFSGAVGCTIEVAAATLGRPIPGTVSQVLWLSLGAATGGAIGNTFVGSVGSVGGAFGGGLGALHARIVAIYIAACTTDYTPRRRDPGERGEAEKMVGRRLSGSLAELGAELQNTALGDTLRDVSGQTARTLSAVSALEEVLVAWEGAAGSPQGAPCWEEAAQLSKEALQQLEMLEEEVKKALASLETCS